MSLLRARIFQSWLFKQGKFLVSAPQRIQQAIYISEAYTISREILPMSIGFCSHETQMMAWNVIHALKYRFKDIDEPVIFVCERSRFPLDPCDDFAPAEKEKMASLPAIAVTVHNQVLANVDAFGEQTAEIKLQEVIFVCCTVVNVLALILHFWLKR